MTPTTPTTSARPKQLNYRYIKENLGDYDRLVVVALNDWHSPQLKNVMKYTEEVNPSGVVNELGTTFLHYASAKQDCLSDSGSSILEILIQAGANVFAKDIDGLTPYMYAHLKNHKTNQSILRREYTFLLNRYERQIERLEKVKNKEILLDSEENADEIKSMRALSEAKAQYAELYRKKELTEDEKQVLEPFKAIKPIMSPVEYNSLLEKTKTFELQKAVWEEDMRRSSDEL